MDTSIDLAQLIVSVNVRDAKSPTTKPKKGEIVVGRLNNTNRRLWHLWNTKAKLLLPQSIAFKKALIAYEKLLRASTTHASAKACKVIEDKLFAEAVALERVRVFAYQLEQLFWVAVHLQIPEILTKGDLDIRAGFSVVYRPTKSIFENSPVVLLPPGSLREISAARQHPVSATA